MASLLLKVVDRTMWPVPGAEVAFSSGAVELGRCKTGSNGTCHITVNGSIAPIELSVTAFDRSGGAHSKTITVDEDAHSFECQFDEIDWSPSVPFYDRHFTALLGSFFLIVTLALGFSYPGPSELQRTLIRGTFALAAGGFVAEVPGFLNVQMNLGARLAVQAGGALAVLVLTFFFVPA